jgi:hypothetical protein
VIRPELWGRLAKYTRWRYGQVEGRTFADFIRRPHFG